MFGPELLQNGLVATLTVTLTAAVKQGIPNLPPWGKMGVAIGSAALFTALVNILDHQPWTSAILQEWLNAVLWAMGLHAMVVDGLQARFPGPKTE